MVQIPSWETNWFAASQEIPRILWNTKVHYRTHKCPPTVPILGQPIPVHIPTSHLLEIHSNIIHPSMPRSPQWSLSLRFPHQDPIRPSLLPHMRHMPCPSHSSRFYHSHNIGWGVDSRKRNYFKLRSNIERKLKPRPSVLLTAVLYNTFIFLNVCWHRRFIFSLYSWRQSS